MSEWKAKRFWKEANIDAQGGGFGVSLDGRPVRTPAKQALVVPTRDLAQAIAAEWQAQDQIIDPESMPFTRSANAAIDKVAPQYAEVADMVAAYGDSDLLCYRADSPSGLVARQAAVWDPYLDWAANRLGARLETRVGLMHAAQDDAALTRLSREVHALDPFRLTAFHDLVALSGSLILGFATAQGHATADQAWGASRLDEDWQSEQWGIDEEAEAAAEVKRAAFLHAKAFHDACTPS